MYLDPGSLSVVLMVIVGTVISIPFLIGVYWGRIRTKLFSKSRSKDANSS